MLARCTRRCPILFPANTKYLSLSCSPNQSQGLNASKVGWLLLYTLVPYVVLLLIRLYVLMKAQVLRRSLRRSSDYRRRMGERTKLVGP